MLTMKALSRMWRRFKEVAFVLGFSVGGKGSNEEGMNVSNLSFVDGIPILCDVRAMSSQNI